MITPRKGLGLGSIPVTLKVTSCLKSENAACAIYDMFTHESESVVTWPMILTAVSKIDFLRSRRLWYSHICAEKGR